MKLTPEQQRWMEEVASEARKAGWTVYQQSLLRQRQHDPSLILVRGPRVVFAYLRMGRQRPDKAPDLSRWDGDAIEAVVWHRDDMAHIRAALI